MMRATPQHVQAAEVTVWVAGKTLGLPPIHAASQALIPRNRRTCPEAKWRLGTPALEVNEFPAAWRFDGIRDGCAAVVRLNDLRRKSSVCQRNWPYFGRAARSEGEHASEPTFAAKVSSMQTTEAG